MSLLDRLDVPLAQSRASTRAVVRPRVTASSAQPAPTTPPPMTNTSTSYSVIAVTASARDAGDSASTTMPLPRVCYHRSVDLHPVQRTLNRFLPACVTLFPLPTIPLWLPAPASVPVGPELAGARPEPCAQAGGIRGAERGRLGHDRPADRHAETIGLQLHAQVVRGHPAVDLEDLQVHARVGLHGLADVAGL